METWQVSWYGVPATDTKETMATDGTVDTSKTKEKRHASSSTPCRLRRGSAATENLPEGGAVSLGAGMGPRALGGEGQPWPNEVGSGVVDTAANTAAIER